MKVQNGGVLLIKMTLLCGLFGGVKMIDLENYIEMGRVQGNYKDIITWLTEHVEDCPRQTKSGHEGQPAPYDFSAISQYARFCSLAGLWKLEIRGQKQSITVWFKNTVDSKTVVKFALRWGKQ
jgi:hypothetical protein